MDVEFDGDGERGARRLLSQKSKTHLIMLIFLCLFFGVIVIGGLWAMTGETFARWIEKVRRRRWFVTQAKRTLFSPENPVEREMANKYRATAAETPPRRSARGGSIRPIGDGPRDLDLGPDTPSTTATCRNPLDRRSGSPATLSP